MRKLEFRKIFSYYIFNLLSNFILNFPVFSQEIEHREECNSSGVYENNNLKYNIYLKIFISITSSSKI